MKPIAKNSLYDKNRLVFARREAYMSEGGRRQAGLPAPLFTDNHLAACLQEKLAER
jgi:hypothetical protein